MAWPTYNDNKQFRDQVFSSFSYFAGKHDIRFGYQFTFHNRLPAQRLIFWGRTPAVLFSLLTALLLFLWIRRLWGVSGALVSLVFLALTRVLPAPEHLGLELFGAAEIGELRHPVSPGWCRRRAPRRPSMRGDRAAGVLAPHVDDPPHPGRVGRDGL